MKPRSIAISFLSVAIALVAVIGVPNAFGSSFTFTFTTSTSVTPSTSTVTSPTTIYSTITEPPVTLTVTSTLVSSITTTTSIASITTTTSTTTMTTTTTTSPEACSYEIFMSGSTTYAENCATGAIVYSGSLPEVVINDAIAASSGGKVYIEAGTYTFTTTPISLPEGVAAIGTTSVSNVELYGQDNETILAAGTNLNGDVIGIGGVSGWNIHDLEVNGNRASQSASGTGELGLNGIFLFDTSNSVIQHCYVHDDKTMGILVAEGSSDQILNDQVVNSNANGIQVYAISGIGSNYLIQNNNVIGASDVGISVSGDSGTGTILNGAVVLDNLVEHINLRVSPYMNGKGGGGNGILVGDNGATNNVTVTGNIVNTFTGSGDEGIGSYPASGTNTVLTISNNQVTGTGTGYVCPVYLNAVSNVNVTDNVLINTVSGIPAINIQSSVSNALIAENTITVNTSVSNAIYVGALETIVLENNTINGRHRPEPRH